jgi:hypothetical protein
MEFFGKTIFKGMTQEEIQAYKERKRKELRAIPDDLGPDWIENLETVRTHFEKEVKRKGGRIVIMRRIN